MASGMEMSNDEMNKSEDSDAKNEAYMIALIKTQMEPKLEEFKKIVVEEAVFKAGIHSR